MSNFHFLKKDLEWKIVKTQGWELLSHISHNPQMAPYHLLSWLIVQERIYTLESWHRARSALIAFGPFDRPCPSLFYTSSREKIYPYWGVQKWVANWDMSADYTCTPSPHPSPFFTLIFSLEQQLKRENYTQTIIPLSGKSRNEWQIEIWVANHFKILSSYYTWTLSWTTYYYHTMQNNHVGETNSSTSSIALDDPSSILMKRLCIFAHTIIHISLLILLLYNGYALLFIMMTREKRILIWLLINYLIKLTNYYCV